MEIIGNDKSGKAEKVSDLRTRNLFIGITLVGIGLLWLLGNFGLLTDRILDAIFSWQMLLVLIGGYLLAQKRWIAGGIMSALGAGLLLADVLDIDVPFDKIAFPLILIAVGLSVILPIRNRN